ncbi:MAG: acetate--CoA ligase family protein [Smithellaceae bacterium]
MDFFFKPQSVAVIGATQNPLKGGNAIVKNLLACFQGKIYPVNPKYREIEGLSCYSSIHDISASVDLAIIFVPARLVLPAVEECINKKIPGVMIESGGFAETGGDGQILQKKLAELAGKSGIRLWGPNCMGLVDAVNKNVFSFMASDAVKGGFINSFIAGPVSLIVQSGMLSAGFLIDIMSNGIMGVSKVCSIGNKIDVDESDLLDYLINDPDTGVIGCYLESISSGRRFIELCRKSPKPIVVLKGGKSPKGAEAAMSHTASLASNHRVLAGVLAQAGVFEANDFKQMMDLCRSLAIYPQRPAGTGRVAILTFSGGAGIVGTDFMDKMHLSIADLSAQTKAALQKIFPAWMPVANPVDIWPALEMNISKAPMVYQDVMKTVLADPGVDAVLLMAFAGGIRLALNLSDIAAQAKDACKPLFIWLLGQRDEAFRFQKEALLLGVPVFPELYRTVECLNTIFRPRPSINTFASKTDTSGDAAVSLDLCRLLESGMGPQDEYISKQILQAHGIPVVKEKLVANIEECLQAADSLGYPLVMKGLFAGGIHKTEMGLVQLGVADRQTATDIFLVLMDKMKGKGKVLLQQQVSGKVELILGLIRDPQLGPCVMLGIGGIMAEVFHEIIFAMAPLSREDALNLIGRFHGQKLLEGFRGAPAVDKEKLAAILIALGNIGLSYPRIKEIDINPLIITSAGVVAVDATIVLD